MKTVKNEGRRERGSLIFLLAFGGFFMEINMRTGSSVQLTESVQLALLIVSDPHGVIRKGVTTTQKYKNSH